MQRLRNGATKIKLTFVLAGETCGALYANAVENERSIVSESFFDAHQIFLSVESGLLTPHKTNPKLLKTMV
jgi:hypothetical protein